MNAIQQKSLQVYLGEEEISSCSENFRRKYDFNLLQRRKDVRNYLKIMSLKLLPFKEEDKIVFFRKWICLEIQQQHHSGNVPFLELLASGLKNVDLQLYFQHKVMEENSCLRVL